MKGDIKNAVWAVMPTAYEEASFGGRIPAPARQVMYAVRRLSGLGDRLKSDYFLKKLLDQYLGEHPDEATAWDIVRDDRGTFREPHTDRAVPLGTIAVREYHDFHDVEAFRDDDSPQLGLGPVTWGPLNRFSTTLYIEKEGFLGAIDMFGIRERYDIAIASCKGYSVKAARDLLRWQAEEYGVRVLVARDFDKAGFGIHDTLGEGFEDLGLRLADVVDDPDLDTMAESVTYDHDPRPNLRLRGATEEEIDFLVSRTEDGFAGRRVELNALVGERFPAWLEGKLRAAGVAKVVPTDDVLDHAWRHAHRRALINHAVAVAYEEAVAEATVAEVPEDLVTLVTNALDDDPTLPWDVVITSLVRLNLEEER